MTTANDFPEITPVREAHRIDEARLQQYLADNVDANFDDLVVEQFEGGQSNPTYLLHAGGKDYVMRKKPPGKLLKSAHAVEREFRVMKALADTPVPVPKMHILCDDESVIGTPFFLMDHIEGRVIVDPSLPNLSKEDRTALYESFIRVLANMHTVNLEEVGLGDYGRAGNYYERQISRWSKQYVASETETIPEMNALMEWLPKNIPDSDETRLVHGDYRMGNMIVHPTEPRIMAVLDWELSTTGHPLADLGYACMMYHGAHIADSNLDWTELGLPTEEKFIATYAKHAGRGPIENWKFYIVYNLFRSGGIVQGVYKRGLDGNASSDQWRERASGCRNQAELAWALVEN